MANYTKPTQADWKNRYPGLKKVGSELKGPCPNCGGTDRFHVRTDGVIGCRHCGDYKAILKSAGFWVDNKSNPPDVDFKNGKFDPPFDTSKYPADPARREYRWTINGTMGSEYTIVRTERPGKEKQIRKVPAGVKLKPGEKWRPYVVNDSPEKRILIVEGHKCVDSAAKNLSDYTIATSDGAIHENDWSFCTDREVIIWPDNDKTGFDKRDKVAKAVSPYTKDIGFVAAFGDPESGDDVVDAIERKVNLRLWVAVADKYEVDDTQTTEPDGRKRYVSFSPTILTDDSIRQAKRKPDVIRGVATGKFGIMAAAPGTGKSMLGLKMCAAVASGKSILGFEPLDQDGQNSLFVSLEEDSDEIALRWGAIKQVYDVDIADRLHIVGEDDLQFHDQGIDNFVTGAVYDLAELIAQTQAKFVVLDPLSQWRLGGEDNATFSLFSSAMKQLCKDCKTTIMVLHHVRKPPPGFKAESHNADAIRGASDLRGAARTILLVDWEPKIAPNVITVSFDKVQYGESKIKMPPLVFNRELVETENETYETGVLIEYKPPHELPMPPYQVDEYRNALVDLFADTESYRSDIQANEWLGVALADSLGIDIGTGRKAAERTNEQNQAIQTMKTNIAKLVRMELIRPTHTDYEYKNRTTNRVKVYKKGSKL